MSTDFLVTREVAEWLRTTPAGVVASRYRGQEPGTLAVKVGRRLLFPREALELWLERVQAEEGDGGQVGTKLAAPEPKTLT